MAREYCRAAGRRETIQADAKGAVQSIALIREVIGQVSTISGTLASPARQQYVAPNEMFCNLIEAARGAGEIARNI